MNREKTREYITVAVVAKGRGSSEKWGDGGGRNPHGRARAASSVSAEDEKEHGARRGGEITVAIAVIWEGLPSTRF